MQNVPRIFHKEMEQKHNKQLHMEEYSMEKFLEYSKHYFINQLLLMGRIFNGIFLCMQLFVMFLFIFNEILQDYFAENANVYYVFCHIHYMLSALHVLILKIKYVDYTYF